jgi:hypothetical protein
MTEQVKGKRGPKPKEKPTQEPVSKAPVSPSVDPIGEDLGDVSNTTLKPAAIESDELVDTFSTKLPVGSNLDVALAAVLAEVDSEVTAAVLAQYATQADFKPTLRPSSVGGEPKGPMPVPKGIFDLVTKDPEWKDKIDSHTAKHGLKSVAHWQDVNGHVKVRCMSSSKFGEVL